MNIPAELVEVANVCDLYGLKHEADVLTNIAQMMMDEQREQSSQQGMMLEKKQSEQTYAPWDNQSVDGQSSNGLYE